MSRPLLTQYVVYENPADHPGRFIVREWQIGYGHAWPGAMLANVATLEEAHAALPRGLFPLGRSDDDDPAIREVWT